ncbi:GAF domain-containing SpoIIE family protein phosphatase [uncultured Phycicoccus sp.]|uniref:GAF domain-containing SpoIIE family protein phosphatase n=1 Tax=uncultured Phycicoccus sp. TaxID=661422 RepID=UPI00260FD10F|nr:SpoIIE family protein phosphatase [uncultured Phycicoccus sp.]
MANELSGRPRPRMSREVGDNLTRLARVTSELAGAATVEAVTKIVTQHMADALGATIAALAVLEGDTVRLLGVRGISASEAAEWEVIPLTRRTTVTDAVRTGRRQVLIGADAIRLAYPGLTVAARGERTTITVPLRAVGRTLGAIHLSIPGGNEPHPVELEFLDVLADTCTQALVRIEAVADAAKQTARLAFLAEASIELNNSLDLDVTIQRVARLAVPDFADWCAIDVVRDGSLHRLAVAHVDPAKVALAMELQKRWPPDPASRFGPMEVVRTGKPLLFPEITDEVLVQTAQDEEHLRVARELDLRSALLVPLAVRGRVTGVITWVSTDAGRRYGEDDVSFAEHLARRASSALDNAELYSQTRAVAEELQRAVLPDQVIGNEHWEVHSRYHPSGRTEVGGDFYDAIPLEDGRLIAFVGDVMGRGVTAAAVMAHMRASIRAFASVDPEPATVVSKLDRMVQQFGADQLVTLLYVLADPAQGVLHVTNAGHIPPTVLRSDGDVERLPFADGAPLGLAEERQSSRVPLVPGDLLLVVTDGLVERRDESLDVGLDRLAAEVVRLGDGPLAVALGELVDRLRDDRYDDDAAALVLRRTTSAQGRG